MQLKDDIVWRLAVIYIGILLISIFIIGKIVYLQFWEKDIWTEKANVITYKDITIKPDRGDICASDGRILASSIPYYEIRMDLKSDGLTNTIFNNNVDTLAYCLAEIFNDKTEQDYSDELIEARKNGARYHLINKRVDYTQLKRIKKFPIFKLGKYKGGFIVKKYNKRIKPHLGLASRTIGYTSKGESGNIVGIEGAYNNELSGTEGIRLMQKLSGNVWMPLSDDNEIEPVPGNDVITAIDVNIQDVAAKALYNQLVKHNAEHGTVILMEVKSGEVKAIANLKKIEEGKYAEHYNYAVGESTEPGSTFKLASIIVALEDGYVDLYDSIETGNGVVQYSGFTIRDSKVGGHGKITVKKVIEVSSNVGITKIIYNNYKKQPTKFIDRLYSMNLNDKLNVEIKGEGSPYIKYPDDTLWSGISLPQLSIGYELHMTPLQILAFYNAIANDGVMIKPKFVKALRQHGNIVKTYETEIINPSICSKETIIKVKKMLKGVVENGTARNLRNSNYKIAGKTGTSQLAFGQSGYKLKDKEVSYQASFVGYFPADKPKYTCIVVINTPTNKQYYGNIVAGPVFKKIADKLYASNVELSDEDSKLISKKEPDVPYTKDGYRYDLDYIFKYLNIPTYDKDVNSNWVVIKKHKKYIEYQNRFVKKNKVPKVEGMGLRDAIYILESVGLKVQIKGRGIVRKQSISAGAKIVKGAEIILELG